MGTSSHRMTTLVALLLFFGACGVDEGGGSATTTQQTTPTTNLADTTTTHQSATSTSEPLSTTTTAPPTATGHAVYFLLGELEADSGGPFLVPVYRESMAGSDASVIIESLLTGPNAYETSGSPSISTAIPAGTSLLGVEIDAGTATVDLSSEFDDGGGSFSIFVRLAQVVYTITRLPDVDDVVFMMEGDPVRVFSGEGIELDGPQTRAGYHELLPLIFVDSPAWGEPVASPIHVDGLSNVLEAVSQVALTDDDGLILFEEMVIATCGTGCWGDWEIDIPYEVDRDQFGALIVWEYSAKDGSRIHIREYPIQLMG